MSIVFDNEKPYRALWHGAYWFKTTWEKEMAENLLMMLKNQAFFKELPAELLESLAEKSHLASFKAGEKIVTQGTHDPRLLVVQEGYIDAYQELHSNNGPSKENEQQKAETRVFLRRLHSPSWIGLTSFLSNRRRSATLIAASEGKYFVIPFEALHSLLSNHFKQKSWPLLQNILETLSEKVRKKNRQLAILTSTSKDSGSEDPRKLNIGVFDSRQYVEDSFAAYESEELGFTHYKTRLNNQTAILAAPHKVICCFVNDDLSASVLGKLKDLGVEMIALRCAGYNQVDLKECQRLGIKVARVPAYSPNAVAEHAVGMLQCINRKLHLAHGRVMQTNFTLEGLVGMDLYKKTIGVIGLGKIGQCFAKIMHGFGTEVIYFDPTLSESYDYAKPASFDDILMRSDVISLHCPLNPKTNHLFDKNAFDKMKPNSIIINTSRGALINAIDLIDALKQRKIAAAALDVYEEEQDYFFEDFTGEVMQDDHLARLISMTQVLVTSHQAFLTKEALENIAETTVDNIHEYFEMKNGNQPIQLKNEVIGS